MPSDVTENQYVAGQFCAPDHEVRTALAPSVLLAGVLFAHCGLPGGVFVS